MTGEPRPASSPRACLIDALNVAYWCGAPPSLRLPLSLIASLLALGHEALLVFDASAPHQLRDDGAIYQQLLHHTALCLQVPSGRSADGELLRRARATSATIISRDGYRDHRRRYRKLIDDPSRVMAGYVAGEVLQVPGLLLSVPLPATTALAWRPLCAASA